MKTSCIMASYNGSKYISEMLKSIINQSELIDEILIIDDNSDDNTCDIILSIINDYHDVNIQLFINEFNQGVTKSFESGINRANGDLIFLADQDDIWMHNKVQIFLEIAKSNPNLNLFYSDGYIVDSNLKELTLISSFFYKD